MSIPIKYIFLCCRFATKPEKQTSHQRVNPSGNTSWLSVLITYTSYWPCLPWGMYSGRVVVISQGWSITVVLTGLLRGLSKLYTLWLQCSWAKMWVAIGTKIELNIVKYSIMLFLCYFILFIYLLFIIFRISVPHDPTSFSFK